jgi:DNA polymerase III epsilon subunit-like protein
MSFTSIIIVDIETTGLDADMHQIIKIAAIEVDLESNKVLRNFHTFSLPTNEDGMQIFELDPLITEVTGITQNDLQGAPDNFNATKKFSEFAGSRTIWAFNGAFVLPFLEKFSSQPFTIYDVMSFAKKTFPDVINRKLTSFAIFLNIPIKHDLLYLDCLTTKEILLRCINKKLSLRADNAYCNSCQWAGKVFDLLMLENDYICPECSESERLVCNFPIQEIPEDIIFNEWDEFFCSICDWKGLRSNLVIGKKKYACPRCTKSKLFIILRCNNCEWINLECFSLLVNGKKTCPQCHSIFKNKPLLRLDN